MMRERNSVQRFDHLYVYMLEHWGLKRCGNRFWGQRVILMQILVSEFMALSPRPPHSLPC